MSPLYYILLVLAVIQLEFANSGPNSISKLPKSFKKCKRRDPQLNSCLKASLKGVLPELVKGVPSLGVLPIDPLNIQNLQMRQGTGPVSVDLTFINVNMTGIGSVMIESVDADWDEYRFDASARLSKPIVLAGDYRIDGKVLVLPIRGIGKCNLTLENVHAAISLRGKEQLRDKRMFMEVKDFDFKFNTTRLHIFLGNLFNGDKALGDNMNTFLNDNWSDILKEIQPSIEEALAEAFKEIANRIFLKVPFNQIALD